MRASPGVERSRSEFKEAKMSELDDVLHAQLSKPTAAEGLVARIDELIASHRTQVLHSTTSTTSCVGELVRRYEGLEHAVRALALAVENLSATDG
jgi:predicted sugar kinase